MNFSEFVNKNKNVVASGAALRISAAIPISEERDAFFRGELFKKYDIVESDGKQYTILEQASNYYHVVDADGNLHRKFANQLTKISDGNIGDVNNTFHGYQIQTEEAQQILRKHIDNGIDLLDDVGILKQLKEADQKVDDYKPKDKLTVAKIIADVVGIPHDAISDPTNLVNAAIRKAKKDPVLMKNKAILQNMLQIAREVGIKYSDNTFEVKESKEIDEAMSPQQNMDFERMMKGAMSRAAYNAKWKKPLKSDAKVIYGKNVKESEELDEHIVKTASGYRLVSKSTGKNLGDFDTKEAAEKHEREVQYFKHQNESQEISELSKTTLGNYATAARKDAVKLGNQGAKSSNLKTSYKKFKKATTRMAGAANAEKKIFAKDWKEKTGQNEAVEAPSAVSYKDLKAKIDNKKNNDPKSVIQKPEPSADNPLPGSTMGQSESPKNNNTVRKMIVNKLSDV